MAKEELYILLDKVCDYDIPNLEINALVDCVVNNRNLWGSNKHYTIPKDEPDYYGLTEEQADRANLYAKNLWEGSRSQLPEYTLYEMFGTPWWAKDSGGLIWTAPPDSPIHATGAGYWRKNANRRCSPNYTGSLDVAITLLDKIPEKIPSDPRMIVIDNIYYRIAKEI